MAETLTNTTNEKGNDNNLVSSVKKAAAILVAALGLTVATSQDVNAQMFACANTKSMLAEKRAANTQKRNENAEKRNTIAGQNEVKAHNNEKIAGQNKEKVEVTAVRANNEKIIAGLRADLWKDNKNPSKSSRSSFAYNSTKPKDNSKIGRDPNN